MMKSRDKLLWAVFVLYILILLRITVFRSDFGTHPLFRDGQILWIPFVSLIRILKNSLSYFIYLFVGNLIWFVPFGFLFPVLVKRGKLVILYGLLLSLLIEICQFIFGTGVTEVEDLILNTAGTAIGYVVYILFQMICQQIQKRKEI